MKLKNKIQLKEVLFLILCSFCFLYGNAQEYSKINKKGQYKNVFHIKFKVDFTKKLDQELKGLSRKKVNEGEYLKLNIKNFDLQNKKYKVQSIKRLFRPAGKFEEKHRKHGLHLWYKVQFAANAKVDQVIQNYQNIPSIEIAEAVYEVKFMDGYSEKSHSPVVSRENIKNTAPNNSNTTPNDPLYPQQWHYNNTGQEGGIPGSDIKLEQAWEIEKGDSRVIVAIGDENMDVSHPDLVGNLWVNQGEIPGNGIDDDNNGYIDDIHGYDFINDTGTLVATSSHGTHVAGTISAETNNGIGVAGIAGGTGNDDGVRLMSCGIIGPGSNAEYFIYAADNGAVISQNSWGASPAAHIPSQLEAIDYFIANAGGEGKAMNGGVVCFATGNDDSNFIEVHSRHANVIGVTATNFKDEKTSYSNYHTEANIAAPGGEARSIYDDPGVLSTVKNGKYQHSAGTSMACPHVSGVAALIISQGYGNINADQVRKILLGTTDHIDHKNPSYAGELGTGRLDAYEALRVTQDRRIPIALKATDITENTANIIWESLNNTSNFELRYKSSNTDSWNTVSVSGNSKDLTNLEDGQWYDIQVRAIESMGNSPFTKIRKFITKPIALQAPVINFTTIGETTLEIDLNPVQGAVTYEIRHKVKNNSNWEVVPVNLGINTHITDLFPNTEYEIQARSYNQGIYSPYSSSQVIRTIFTPCGDVDPWQPKTYTGSGTKVSYEGFIYQNKWHAGPNHIPGKNNVWSKKEECNPDSNTSPTVSITTPTNGQIFEQETLSAITLSANASDTDGTIASIQFEVNGTILPQGNNISWTPTSFGDYTIKVTVTDDKGATATHQISITVNQKTNNQVPTVNITQPNDGQVFEQETLSAIILSANATDSDGTIASVQFEVNGTSLTQGNNINWTPTTFGNYTIKVTATDDKGAIATHQISITVNQKTSNQVPTVNITQPNDGQVFEQETLSAITLSANASDSDGTIISIQFEVNDTLLTQGNNISWTPNAFGTYTIKATATDDKGATATHQVSITVKQKNNNQAPTVTITQPNDGQVFEQETLSAITLSANASDPDGTIASIQFEVNNTLLAQGNNISWTPNAFGAYTIKVIATDDKGATATQQITITVKQKDTGGDCNGIPAWDPSIIYPPTGGVKVSYNNNIYQNKWWTQNNEPGTGGPWGPWELIGPCASSSILQKTISQGSFIIAPNPAKDILNITLGNNFMGPIKITLYDVTGKHKIILDTKNKTTDNYQLSYDISQFSTGFYFLKVHMKGQTHIQKVLIK